MGFDLEKRVANELNRLEDEVARSPDIKPARRLEEFRRVAAELKARMLGGEATVDEQPGKRTQLDEMFGDAIARMRATAARAQQQLGMLPWQQQAGFDDYRARGLRDVLHALGGERASLQRATLGAAEPAVAARVQRGTQPRATDAGHAMWRVAERRAATLYRHAMDAGEVASEDPIVDEALARCGNGQPLPTPVRKKMEAELGISLARVRVHTDPVAAAAAKAVRADAFTVGEDIFFAEHRFAPDSREGQKLLAHELTHVVQAYQGRTSTGSGGFTVSQPGEALEREADAIAERVERRAERAAHKPQVESMRMRFGSSRTARYAPAAHPISVVGPRPAAAPIAPAPSIAAPAPGVQLLRRAAVADANETRAKVPRENQPGEQKGTQPKFERLRDRVREDGLRTTKKGPKLDAKETVQQGKKLLDGAVTDLKQEVKKAKGKPVGKKAKEQGKQGKAKQKQLKKQAKDAKKKSKPATGTGDKLDQVQARKKDGGGGEGKGPVKFKKISDWAKYMPEDLPDTDEREKKRILGLVKKKVNGERKQSQGMLNQLANAQKAEAAAIRKMGPGLVAQIRGETQQSIGKVSSAESSQVAAVQSAVAAEQARVRSHASSMVGQINGAHAAAMSSIRSADRNAKQKLTDGKTAALNAVNTARSASLVAVNIEYMTATSTMLAIGADKAAEALALPSQIALPYSGDKLEAAEKAAKEVAAEYSAAMPGEAQKAAADLRSTKGEVDAQVNDMAEQQRTAINQAYDQARQAVDEATRQATDAANTLKEQAVSQVQNAASTTSSQLATHGQQQVAAIRSAAQGARASIQQAGDAAAESMGESVEKAAKGIESGVQGLCKGAKQIESPDPMETRTQVAEAAQQLKQGSRSIVDGFRKSIRSTVDGLNSQADGAAQGMQQTATQAKATAAQMANGACQSMTGIANGAKEGLTQLAEGHRENVTQTADRAKDQMKEMADKLKEAYEKLRTTLNGKLTEACDNARTQFSQAVPTEERAAILENAKKAADAVKPWWQKALAFVVQIVVAVAITIAVGALIGATGGLGLIAVGLLAGALSTVGGQMAHNLVMGESLFNGITVRSVLAGAIGGAVTAGFGAGLSSGLTAFGGATGKSIATNLATKGAGGFTGALTRTTAGVAGDFVGDVATQLVATGQYNFSMQSLATSIVMNGATQGKRYGDFETRMQQGIRARVPSIDISTGRSNSPMGARPDGQTGDYFNTQVNRRGEMGKLQTPPANNRQTGNDGQQNRGGGNDGQQNRGGGNDGQQNRGGANDGPNNRGSGDGDTRTTPDTTQQQARGDADTTQGRGRNDGPEPSRNRGDGDGGNQTRGDSDGNPTRNRGDGDGNQTRGDADGNTRNRGDGDGNQTRGDADGNTRNRGDADGNQTRNRGDGDADGNQTRNRGDADTDGNNTRGDGDGNNRRGDGDGDGNNRRGDGEQANNRRGDADGDGDRRGGRNNDGDDAVDGGGGGNERRGNRGGDDGGGGDDGPANQGGPENDLAGDLADMGYPNATRAKGDEAAGAIESGGRPNNDALRDTDANQQGRRQLQDVDADPTLSPESKQNIRRDVAEQLRADEPSGNLARDIADAKTREQARVQAEQAAQQQQGQDGQQPGQTQDGPNQQQQGADGQPQQRGPMADDQFYQMQPGDMHRVAGDEIASGALRFDSQEAAARWAQENLNSNVESLPQNQKDAVHNYTMEGGANPTYREMNGLLRDQAAGRASAHDTADVRQNIQNVDAAMQANKLPETVTVVRGTGRGHIDAATPADMIGRTFNEAGYVSTSLGDNGAVPAFADKDMILHLQVPEGTPAIWVEKVGAFGMGERELLLTHGGSYTVDRAFIDPTDGKWHVYGRFNPP